jgi:hypothetical protein
LFKRKGIIMAAAIPAGAIFLVVSDWLDGWSQKEVETAAPSLRGAMEECRKRDNWQ